MDTISASDAKNRFRALLDKVQLEPVIISRNGRPVATVMSTVEFDTRLSFRGTTRVESTSVLTLGERVNISDVYASMTDGFVRQSAHMM